MEFEKTYKEAFNKAHIKTESYIKEYLTNKENAIYNFTENSKNILDEYYQSLEKNKFQTQGLWCNLYVEFENSRKKIKINSIQNSFQIKVLPLFNTYVEESLIDNTYTFENLIEKIAEYNSRINTYRLFRNHFKLFEMIYDSNDYSKFEIKEYDTSIENTKVFKYYKKLKYPHHVEVELKTETKNPQNTSITNDSENEIKYKLSLFEENEKLLLLHALYYYIDKNKLENNNIDLTQFLRTILICQGLTDLTIFEDKYMKKFYSRVNKGIEYLDNISKKKKLIESTLSKTKDLKIPEIEEYLKGLR